MIVHDIDEEENLEEERKNSSTVEAQENPSLNSPAAPRTRKAKETQTRLGVGKPLAAGGQGPRAVTRSSGSSRGKESKLSKSHKPKEPTIQEGESFAMIICHYCLNESIRVGSSERSNKRSAFILLSWAFILCISWRLGGPAQGSNEQQNDEHPRLALDNKVFDVNSIVENAVSHMFPKSCKPEFNIPIGPAFAGPNQGFEIGARTIASYKDRRRRTPTQKYEITGSIRKFKCSLCLRHFFEG